MRLHRATRKEMRYVRGLKMVLGLLKFRTSHHYYHYTTQVTRLEHYESQETVASETIINQSPASTAIITGPSLLVVP